jgi:hypothetical protein
MKKIAITMALLIAGMTSTFAQVDSDSISMKKVFGGYQFYQGEQRLNMRQLVNTMKPDPLAYDQIRSAKSSYNLAMVFSYAGGFMIGWPLGTAIAGGDPEWVLAGIGAGLIAITIPISRSFNKKAQKAVDTFNEGLAAMSFWKRSELSVSTTGNGVGLVLRF